MGRRIGSLALDCGGSKVQAILYDGDFSPIRCAKSGSIRPNTTSPELARAHASELFERLGLQRGDEIDLMCGISDGGAFHELLSEAQIQIGRVQGCGELQAGLSAANLTGDGYLALSGTGSTFFARYEGRHYSLGGYGASVSDEGSGYDMGRRAFAAAIRDAEGRGEKTLLTDLIAGRLGCAREDFRSGIFRIYGQSEHSPVAYVASCAPLVSSAAKAGDRIAIGILTEIGRALGEQLLALKRLEQLPDLPITLSGSVWRSDRRMFDAFSETIRRGGMSGEIVPPAFEPIVGAILDHYRRERGAVDEVAMKRFAEQYAPFTFALE